MGNSWRACVPVAGKTVKPHGLFACGSQVGVELYRRLKGVWKTQLSVWAADVIAPASSYAYFVRTLH